MLVGPRRAFLVAIVVGVLKGLGLSPYRETRQVALGLGGCQWFWLLISGMYCGAFAPVGCAGLWGDWIGVGCCGFGQGWSVQNTRCGTLFDFLEHYLYHDLGDGAT